MLSPRLLVLEVMMIHSCDKCIFVKSKYILALDLASAAANHLFPHGQTQRGKARPKTTVRVVLETEEGTEDAEMPDYSSLDPTIADIARTMDHHYAVLLHLLRKHGLVEKLQPHLPPSANAATLTNWRTLSLTQLRSVLIRLFTTISLSPPKNPALANHSHHRSASTTALHEAAGGWATATATHRSASMTDLVGVSVADVRGGGDGGGGRMGASRAGWEF
ncbi:uncharacterized protein EV422DRAFT_257793 [Fimicolochytrium jonesii]|uniref:uncharacterized protein n=1 Tax=Fimicolochytrium jonesii TaxID=1396493 RepID=UPI0022FDDA9A|nr:uncharacterized protein EV422DRAFT_257793 [Fimicolochytrium jonesii]KAI8817164.1 hypothetical protein EV422DRAFT_257793 [Fimicolochytrium jonesii]